MIYERETFDLDALCTICGKPFCQWCGGEIKVVDNTEGGA